MKGAVCIFIAWCFFAAPVLAEDPVDFADPRLKAAVEDALWIPDPTPTDMLGLVELIHSNTAAQDLGITDLTGLEHATNLQTLNLRGHQINSLSPLAGLINLETLILQRNYITNISALSNLTHLTKLDLERNDIQDITVLSGLSELRWLSLHRNQVSDIFALTQLTSLTFLDLRITPLNEEAYNTYIDQIKANNPGIYFVHDPAYHRRLQIESTQGGAVTDPGEGDFTYVFQDVVWVFAEADPCYAFAGYVGSYTTSQNPMQIAMQQDYDITARFESQLDTIYVDDNAPSDPGPNDVFVSDPQENGTAGHPFDRIQKAIGVAAKGACVLVRPGRYCETIDLAGKRIRLTSIDPNEPGTNGYPIIDGQGRGPVVSFTTGEDPNCVLTGFVITGGRGQETGAILCTNSSPTIANCLIVGNRTTGIEGAAIHCKNSQATLINSTIVDNDTGQQGAALRLVDSDVTLWNSILWENGPNAMALRGTSEPAIRYSNVAGGWSGLENLDTDPLFARRGYWADPDNPSLILDSDNNKAVWISGDYHLKSQTGRWEPETQTWVQDEFMSPCIDAGDPLTAVGQEPDPNGGIVNMGAYGGMAQTGKSY